LGTDTEETEVVEVLVVEEEEEVDGMADIERVDNLIKIKKGLLTQILATRLTPFEK